MIGDLTTNQELYCQRRALGESQRVAYRRAYPRSDKWKEKSVDECAARLEANIKVSARLEELFAQAAKQAVLTRTGLINRIAHANALSYDLLTEKAQKGIVEQSVTSAFVRTSKHLLEYELVNDAETTDYQFVADYGLLLPAAYIDIHRDIHAHTHTDYAFKGGRGSDKSSAISLEIPKLMLRDPLYNTVVIRKVFNTLRKSVFPRLRWSISMLGHAADFRFQFSPLEITYIPTGQKIYFLGLDDHEKIKSFTCEQGYAAIQWWEEYHQFSPDDIRSVNQSLARGGSDFWRFYSWNPPRNKNHWINKWAAEDAGDRIVHHSTYLMVPVEWLGERFVKDAEELAEINELAYRHEYLGEDVGTDGEVFENLELREITDEEIAECDYLRCGADWGYFPDPFVFGPVGYNSTTKTVYILDEVFGLRLSDEQAVEKAIEVMSEEVERNGETVKEFNARAKHNEVYCDSAEPKSIASWQALGINALPVKKWKGSVDAGIKWLQTRAKIVIDPKRAPLSAQEFSAYEYADDGNGGLKTYPDKDNHSIDKARYALSGVITSKKET